MSMTQTLAPHLPYLRRYARALTGSQASGDAHVRAALQALLAGEEAMGEGVPARVGLYRLFHAIWQSGAEQLDTPVPAGGGAHSAGKGLAPEDRLAALDGIIKRAIENGGRDFLL